MNLEEQLKQRPCNESPELRRRVMAAVEKELAKPEAGEFWVWAAVAAGILIALNLAAIDGSRTEFRSASRQISGPVQELQQIDALEQGAFQ